MSYNIEDSDQIKFKHFKELKLLPDLFHNYDSTGWFSESALRSMMYSSGYTQIKNTDMNLVKVFDPHIVNNNVNKELVEGYSRYDKDTYNSLNIENIADEKYDDLEFEAEDIQKMNQYTYFNAGCEEGIEGVKNKVLATFIRYNTKLKDLDIGIKNLVRTSEPHASDRKKRGMTPYVFIIEPDLKKEDDRKKAIKTIIKKCVADGMYKYAWDEDVQKTMDEVLAPKKEEINKLFSVLLRNINDLLQDNIPGESIILNIHKSIVEGISNLHSSIDTVFADEVNELYDKGNFKLVQNIVDKYLAYTYDGKKYKDYESSVITLKNKIELLKDYILAEYEIGIGFTEKNGEPIRLEFTTDQYKSKSVYYANSDHCVQDYTMSNGTYFDGTICERSAIIDYATMKKNGLTNYKFTGIRLYFSINFAGKGKPYENAPDFETYATKSLTDLKGLKNQLGEIALMFRYGEGDSAKLYRYMIDLHGYETVINNEYNHSATYFVPFILNLQEEKLRKLQYEGWYGEIKNEKYIPGVSQKAVIKKAYVQIGNFRGDKFDINNHKTGAALKRLGNNAFIIDKNTIRKYNPDEKQKVVTKEHIQREFDGKLLTAEDLQDVVIGCFTNKVPDYNAKPSNWAYSFNPNAIKINLKKHNKYSYKINATDELGNSCNAEGFDFETLFNQKNTTLKMKKFTCNGITYEKEGDATNYVSFTNTIVHNGDTIFTAEFEGPVEYFYYNKDKYITRINDMYIIHGSTGEIGGPADFTKATEELAIRVMKNEAYVNSKGKFSRYSKSTTEKCALYVDSVGIFTHGYGISYPSEGLKGTETYTQMKKFDKDYSGVFTKTKIGQIKVVNIDKPSYTERKNNFKKLIKEKDQIISDYLTVKGYEISQDDAKECTRHVLQTDYINRVIEYDLKPMYRALYGLKTDAPVSLSDIQNSVIAGLDQTAFEILVDLRYNGNVGGQLFTKYVVHEIQKKVNEKKLPETELKKIFADTIKKQAKLAASRHNEYNDRHKQFAEDVFYLRDIKSKYNPSDAKVINQKLKIKVECISNVDGYLESIFGSAFDEFRS